MKTDISEKNTKKEIVDAYNKLLRDLQEKPVDKDVVEQLSSVGKQFENSLTQSAEELSHNIQGVISQIKTKFDSTAGFLSKIQELAEKQKRQLEEERQETAKQRKREEEEYGYEFERKKKRQEEELQEKRDEILSQEKELKELRGLVNTFDSKMEEELKEAISDTEKKLNIKFGQEKELSQQQSKSQIDLLNQKIISLQETINSYKEDVSRLNSSLLQTQQQLSNIAERAVTKINTSSLAE